MNKTITMYELLGLVKDGKAPKKIRYNNDVYVYVEKYGDYRCEKTLLYLSDKTIRNNDYNRVLALNDEVEILEEEKKIPEKLDTYKENNEIFLENFCYKNLPIHKDSLTPNERVIVYKLNEVIDCLKSKGDK